MEIVLGAEQGHGHNLGALRLLRQAQISSTTDLVQRALIDHLALGNVAVMDL